MNQIKFVYILWFLHIFRPEWVVSYYIPSLNILRAAPRLLLYVFAVNFFFSSIKKKNDIPFLLFIISIALSSYFAHNAGIARSILKQYIDYYLFFVFCLVYIDNEETFTQFFNIFLAGFWFYFFFGLFYRGMVPFHPLLGDEDAFGPYMAMGVVASYFSAFRNAKVDKKLLIGTFLFTGGVVLSFARGALVGLVFAFFFIWLKSKRKIATFFVIICIAVIGLSASFFFFEGSQYLEEIKTITEASEETEGDRIFYWTKAVEIFKDNPLLGVGSRNYGFVLPDYITPEESFERGMFTGFWYGRVPHSIYFQLLSEQGLVGVLSFLCLLWVFGKRASYVQKKNSSFSSEEQRNFYYVALSVKGIMIIYLVTGAFYDFLYSQWVFEFFLLMTLLFSLDQKNEVENADE